MTRSAARSDRFTDQAFRITYVGEMRPDPKNLAMVVAAEKHAIFWATDADEAHALFNLGRPEDCRYIISIGPIGISRDAWIDFTDEERRLASGKPHLVTV